MAIKVAFYKANQPKATWQDKLIAWKTGGIYSHVELILSDGYMYSTSPRDNGVRKKKHKYDTEVWDYIDLGVPREKEKEILKFFAATKGKKYDWLGILGFVLPLADRENKYFCSEWVTKALIIAHVRKLYTKEPSKESPNSLYFDLTN